MPPDLSKNPNVQRGVALEDEARLQFQNKHLTCVMPACAECDVDPIFRASFDGLTPLNEPVEFKCPGDKVLTEVRTEGLKAKTVQMYSVQVQHERELAMGQEILSAMKKSGKSYREIMTFLGSP